MWHLHYSLAEFLEAVRQVLNSGHIRGSGIEGATFSERFVPEDDNLIV